MDAVAKNGAASLFPWICSKCFLGSSMDSRQFFLGVFKMKCLSYWHFEIESVKSFR
jgi:hypothetical protein